MRKFLEVLAIAVALIFVATIPMALSAERCPNSSTLEQNHAALKDMFAKKGETDYTIDMIEDGHAQEIIKRLASNPGMFQSEVLVQNLVAKGTKVFYATYAGGKAVVWGVFDKDDCLVVSAVFPARIWKTYVGEGA